MVNVVLNYILSEYSKMVYKENEKKYSIAGTTRYLEVYKWLGLNTVHKCHVQNPVFKIKKE